MEGRYADSKLLRIPSSIGKKGEGQRMSSEEIKSSSVEKKNGRDIKDRRKG